MNLSVELLSRIRKELDARKVEPTDPLVGVSIPQQQCYFFKPNLPAEAYPVSTSRNPPCNRENSFGTPTGLHRVAEKFGDAQPEGMVFRGRVPTGTCYTDYEETERGQNLITSRILRLEGMDDGMNRGPGVDSYERYIYFHGTNHEERIGEPFSGGCIEFRNRDIIDLFPRIPVGTLVWINPE